MSHDGACRVGAKRRHRSGGRLRWSGILGVWTAGCGSDPPPTPPPVPQEAGEGAPAAPVAPPPVAAPPSDPPLIFTTAVAALGTEDLALRGAVIPPDGRRRWSAECVRHAKDPEVPSWVQVCEVEDVDVWTAHFGPADASRPAVTLQVLHLPDPYVAGTAAHEVELHVERLTATRLAEGASLIKEPATTWVHGADVVLVRGISHGPFSELEDTFAALRALEPDPSIY